jgi:tRNA uridine 5-carboxymethylaminomethyl modification enzyme
MPHGRRLGLVTEAQFGEAMRSEDRIASAQAKLSKKILYPDRQTRQEVLEKLGIEFESPTSLHKLLQRNDLKHGAAVESYAAEIFSDLSREEKSILASRVRYEGYIRREKETVERLKPLESRRIPHDFDYGEISGLSREIVEKCSKRRPRTVGEASRIPGMTPAAVAIISARVARSRGAAA